MKKENDINELLNDEITSFLIQAHLDLFNAEEDNDAEECGKIKLAIMFALNQGAEIFAATTGTNMNIALELLNKMNDEVYHQLRGRAVIDLVFANQQN